LSKDKIFISHATPADNDFTKWLALKLVGLGYNVWCDILFLDKGVDFWKTIEQEIRGNTCRFLVVLSNISNQSEGVLKEIAVAGKIKKELKYDGFIIPLMIDSGFSYDKLNIELNRLNAVDFTQSWIKGLRELLKSFEDNNIPKNPGNLDLSNDLYNKIFLRDRTIIKKDEAYDSNWFSIKEFPPYLYFHAISQEDIDFMQKPFSFPTLRYKNTICSFSSDIGYKYKGNDLIEKERTVKIATDDILHYRLSSPFIEVKECRLFLIQLANKAFNNMMSTRELKTYDLTNKTAYWFEKGCLPTDKIGNVLMVGKRKLNNWHFGISGYAKLLPFPILIVSSHIFFTSDGKALLPSKEKQFKLRIKQGKSWYNDVWKKKLLALMNYLAGGNQFLEVPVGNAELVKIHSRPKKFLSHSTYISPNTNFQDEDIIDVYNEELDEDDSDI
jgi:hypothetical protein